MGRGATLVDTSAKSVKSVSVDSAPDPERFRVGANAGQLELSCEHWRDHHEASRRAAGSASGRAREGRVRASRQAGSNKL